MASFLPRIARGRTAGQSFCHILQFRRSLLLETVFFYRSSVNRTRGSSTSFGLKTLLNLTCGSHQRLSRAMVRLSRAASTSGPRRGRSGAGLRRQRRGITTSSSSNTPSRRAVRSGQILTSFLRDVVKRPLSCAYLITATLLVFGEITAGCHRGRGQCIESIVVGRNSTSQGKATRRASRTRSVRMNGATPRKMVTRLTSETIELIT